MKKVITLFSFFAFATILFSACKKSDDAVTPTTLETLQGKWTFQKEYYHDNYAGVETRDTTIGTSTDYADFRTDGKVYLKDGSQYDTASYALLGDTKLITTSTFGGLPYSDTLDIITLNSNQLTVYNKTFDPAPDYYESTDFYTK